jgi:hypothetical protein
MNQTKPKLPKKDGAKKASETFENMRKKVPSDALVKIISEISPDESSKKEDDRAAKDAEI